MITLHTYREQDFHRLRPIWQQLEQGREMTYFQTYEWNKMLFRALPYDGRHFETLFLLVSDDDTPLMLAPLWILKKTYKFIHKPAIYLFGNGGWSDYLNFIYRDFSEQAVACIFSYLKEAFPSVPLCFSSLKESTSLYQYLQSHYPLITDRTGVCVSLFLPSTTDEWWQSLSKHSRQNLRTAHNRMQKDGITYNLNFDDRDVDKEHCIRLRALRSEMKAVRDEQVKWTTRLKRKVKSLFLEIPSRGGYHPLYDDPNAKIMTIRREDGEMLAYFHYAFDPIHQEIVVLSAGVDKYYERYSPGMILLQAYIESAIAQGTLRLIDFTRGAEPYKLALGGTPLINHSVELKIES